MPLAAHKVNTLHELTARFATTGRVEAIILRPGRDAFALSVAEAVALPGAGLQGDRRSAHTRAPGGAGSKRELTLIQAEHLVSLAGWVGVQHVDPRLLRRNLVVSGLNLVSMRSTFSDRTLIWRIGAGVLIEVTGPCDPCSRMEQALGPGGYNAMRGVGGVTARILLGGRIKLGDAVSLNEG